MGYATPCWHAERPPALSVVLAVVFFQWAGSEQRRNRTRDRTIDRVGDAELDAYNARLGRLAQADRR